MTKKKRGFTDGYKTYDTSGGYGNSREWQDSFYQRMTSDEAKEHLHKQGRTPYEILGITPDASPDEIKKAYRSLIKEWHPDRNQHREAEALAMSKDIIAAYEILKS